MSDDKLSLIKANAGLAKLVSSQSDEIASLRTRITELEAETAMLRTAFDAQGMRMEAQQDRLKSRVAELEERLRGVERAAVEYQADSIDARDRPSSWNKLGALLAQALPNTEIEP